LSTTMLRRSLQASYHKYSLHENRSRLRPYEGLVKGAEDVSRQNGRATLKAEIQTSAFGIACPTSREVGSFVMR